MVEFSLNEKNYSVERPKLRKWLDLEKLRSEIYRSAERQGDSFVLKLFSYLSVLLGVSDEEFVDAPWFEVIGDFHLCTLECAPKLDLSLIYSGKKSEDKGLPEPWEYEQRMWYSWIHVFAKNYGWSIEYVSDLDVDDAFALLQEASLDDQFRKEWEWGLSEIAYKYDKSTKKSTLQKLPRPKWMLQANKKYKEAVETRQPVVKVRPEFVPPGVLLLDGQEPKTLDNAGDIDPT